MKKLLWTTNCKLKNWWLWKVHLSTRVVFDKIYLIPDIRRHPHLVPCHFGLTSEVIAHRLYLDMPNHFLSLKTTLTKDKHFQFLLLLKKGISLIKSHWQKITNVTSNSWNQKWNDFEAKNWNGYTQCNIDIYICIYIYIHYIHITRLTYNCDSDPEIFFYSDDKKLEEKKHGKIEGEKYTNFCRGEYCCDTHVLHERGRRNVREKLD